MAKSKKVQYDADVDNDKLISDLADIINKSNADGGNIAFVFGDESDDDPSKIIDWVPSGNDALDLVMGNRPNAGYPVGRITELTGLEGSGKSLLAMHALAETQKKGGVAVFIDTESSLDINFVRAIGVKVEELLYISCDHVEEIFDHTETLIEKVRGSTKDKLVTIVVDSVAAASCKTEMEAGFDKDGYATQKAIIISKAMRKITQLIARQRICLIFTNQLRQNIGAMFGDKWTTSGGKAIAFHSSIRLRLSKKQQIKNTRGDVIGFTTIAKVVKNRLGPPMRQVEFDLFFDRGMDNYGGWFDILKTNNIAKKAKTKEQKKKLLDKDEKALDNYIECDGQGTKLEFEASDGKVYELTKANFLSLIREYPSLKDEIYQKLCDFFIMKYKDQSQCESEDIVYEDSDD